jgi:dipeptidyl-peptidase 4
MSTFLKLKVGLLMILSLTDLTSAQAAETAQPDLTIARLFTGKEFTPQAPGKVVWCPRSTTSYLTLMAIPDRPTTTPTTSTAPADEPPVMAIARVDLASGATTVLVNVTELTPAGATKPLTIEAVQVSDDESKLLLYTNSQRVWRQKTRGDYWVFDLTRRTLVRLGGEAKPATLQFAKFSPTGAQVAFVRENNLYVQHLDDLRIHSLTTDGSPTCINGTADWVNEEELGIRDGFRWSPDGQALAFWQFDTSGVAQFHLIDNTADRYPHITTFAYPKVGQVNSATRIGVVALGGGSVTWMAVPGDARDHYLPSMQWTPTGNRLLIQQLNRRQNANLFMIADAQSGVTTTVFSDQDAAWVDSEGPVTWVDGGKSFLWLSERDGWRHAYLVSTDGSSCTLITPGNFDVLDIEAVDAKQRMLYFSASPDAATQRYLFRVPLSGGPAERLSPTNRPGWHTYEIAPDAQWAVHSYSTFTTPPVVSLIRLPDHATVRVLADNAKMVATLAALRQPTTGFLKLDVGNGLVFDAWFIHPPQLNRQRKHPMLVHVYGEPAGQTVKDAWGGARGLWHWMLAQAGYLVVSVDCRGTKVPRGREFRKSVFHQIGIMPPADMAAATQAFLQRWDFADPERVGVWGWSGGGSNSLNMLFRYPELFSTAIAIAPNADQLLYDTIYQERYMGLPSDNAENYRLGSPLTHAKNFRGNLLLIHGTGDDNCHYQGTEKLMNELIRLDKDFSVMPYPMRSHAIAEGDNTVPHLYGLMTKYLATHLPVQ